MTHLPHPPSSGSHRPEEPLRPSSMDRASESLVNERLDEHEPVKIVFFTVLVLRSAVREKYRGGEAAFTEDFSNLAMSEHLYRSCAMSGFDLEADLRKFESGGLDRETSMAVGEMMHGKIGGSSEIHFIREGSEFTIPCWFARLKTAADVAEELRRKNNPVFTPEEWGMLNDALARQKRLHATIHMVGRSPERRPFSWRGWTPESVRSAEDLPPYLILGALDPASFSLTPCGWSARWQGTEKDTYFDVKWGAGEQGWTIRQAWYGIDLGYSNFQSRLPLDKAISHVFTAQYLNSAWERDAKRRLEAEHPLTFLERPEHAPAFFGLPDGDMRTLLFPVRADRLRPAFEFLDQYTRRFPLSYPVFIEARLVRQVIHYAEGRAPEWTTKDALVYAQSLRDTGFVPQSLPDRAELTDGSAEWSLRRDSYFLFVMLPFAGLTDFIDLMKCEGSPFRETFSPDLRPEMRPVVMPAGFEHRVPRIEIHDPAKTTRVSFYFSMNGSPAKIRSEAELRNDVIHTADALELAERVNDEVEARVNHVLARKNQEGLPMNHPKPSNAEAEAHQRPRRRTELARRIDAACSGLSLETPKVVPAEPSSAHAKPAFTDPLLVATDSVTAALSERGVPTILIFGSCRCPGGGWDGPCEAQEEGVSKCGTWAVQAEKVIDTYYCDGATAGPIGAHQVLFTRGYLLRDAKGTWLAEPLPVNYVAFAAPNAKAFRHEGVLWVDAEVRRALLERCVTTLRLARTMAPDSPLLLGPIGTGAFGLDSKMVAECWREALEVEGCPPGSKMLMFEGPRSDKWKNFEAAGFMNSTV